jgi:hypothetical protein
MLDAEIAVTLLNRWAGRPPTDEAETYLELLREGGLTFAHHLGHVVTQGDASARACEVESLLFEDGSRAVRIGAHTTPVQWTRWAALVPTDETAQETAQETA